MLLEKLNKDLIQARKDNNVLVKNLLSTLKGELELSIKKGSDMSDETLTDIAFKMRKNAILINSKESLEEADILVQYIPNLVTEEDISIKFNELIQEHSDEFEAMVNGDKKSFGFFCKTIKNELPSADGKEISAYINKFLNILK